MKGQHIYHGTRYIPCEGIDRKKRFSVKKKTAGKDDTEFKDGKNAGAPITRSIDEKSTICIRETLGFFSFVLFCRYRVESKLHSIPVNRRGPAPLPPVG